MSKVALKYSGAGPFYGYAGEERELVDVAEGETVQVSESAAKQLQSDYPTFFENVQVKPASPQVKK